MPDHLLVSEAIWIAASLAGLAVNVALWLYYHGDWRALRADLEVSDLGPLQVVAWGNLRREAVRGVVQACFLFAGVIAAYTPPPPSASFVDPYSEFRLAILIAIVAGQVLVVANSWLDWLTRRALGVAVAAWLLANPKTSGGTTEGRPEGA